MSSISVALCTYNGARYLQTQLDSIAWQTRPPSEVVICDDASCDATLEIAQAYSRQAAYPVVIHRNQRNMGTTANFEQAIRLCSGSLIALCDQDDVWLPNKLDRLEGCLRRHPTAGGVFSDADLIGSAGEELGRRLSEVYAVPRAREGVIARNAMIDGLLRRPFVSGATLMIRAEAREFCLPISPRWVHDAWICWMLGLYSEVLVVEESLIRYRIHDRQQIGLQSRAKRGPSRLLAEISRAVRNGRMPYVELRDALCDVRGRWISRPGLDYESTLASIDGKLAFLMRRINLPQGLPRRCWEMLFMLGDYARYGGLAGAARDLLVSR